MGTEILLGIITGVVARTLTGFFEGEKRTLRFDPDDFPPQVLLKYLKNRNQLFFTIERGRLICLED